MMKKMFKSIPSALVAASMVATSFTGLTATAANAQDLLTESDADREIRCKRQKPHKAKYQMTQRFYRKFEKTEDMMAEKRYSDIDRVLQGLLNDSKTNPYEKTMIWQQYAAIAFDQNDNAGAIRALENYLKLRDALRPKAEVQMQMNLANLYYAEDQAQRAINMLEQWEKKAYDACALISANQIAFLAIVHYGEENYDKALNYIYKAIKKAEITPEITPRENWYTVAMASHWERKEFRQGA